ncbi:MAG: MurR/RpiR family transcriptional regulator [Erysipelotrichaceae bacterium]|nr:MurR/RpiR family transcriptional regulator [Erysipelotrichaceae bacterium]
MNKKMSADLLIKSNYKNLTKSEKKAADYSLNNADKIFTQTLREFSTKCGIGEATTMRFIKKMGYANFAEFKMAIAALPLKDNKSSDEHDPIVDFQEDINEITNQTLLANDKALLEKAVDYIEDANHLVFMGHGTSGYVAQMIAYFFNRAGRECEDVTDIHYSEIRSVFLKEGDVLVAISHSGDNVDIIGPVKRAKENGCTIITVTAYKTTMLQKFADIPLFHSPGPLEHRIYGAGMRNVMTQQFLVELLYIIYKQRHLEEVLTNQELTAISTADHHTILKG